MENTAIIIEVCLLIRCLVVDVLLRAFAVAGMCLPSRCQAIDIHVTVFSEASDSSCGLF
jgi:hypothetical protein